MSQDEPKIQIDTDWKAEAQAEKTRLAEEAETAADSPEGGQPGKMPPADFQTLVGALASQAVMSLGAVRDPKSGGVVIDLPGARFAIDLLGVVEAKTKGNLEPDEEKAITQALSELRDRFVQISQAVAAQQIADVQTATGTPSPTVTKD